MNALQDIRPISEVKQNFFAIAEQVERTGRPVYITKNGRVVLVLVKTEYLQSLEDEKQQRNLKTQK